MQATVERAIVAALTETGKAAKAGITEAAERLIAAEATLRREKVTAELTRAAFVEQLVQSETPNPMTGRKHSATSAAEMWPHTADGHDCAERLANAEAEVTRARAAYECAKVDGYLATLAIRGAA